jgi:hypothetical protein
MTEVEKLAARARRRAMEARGRIAPRPDVAEPSAYLEALRIPLIDGLLDTLDTTQSEGLATRIRFQLLHLSSLGRTRVDLATESKFADPAITERLSHLSPAELARLAGISPVELVPDEGRNPEKGGSLDVHSLAEAMTPRVTPVQADVTNPTAE